MRSGRNPDPFYTRLLFFTVCGTASYPQGQTHAGNSNKTAPIRHCRGDLDGFLNRQAEVTLDLVDTALLRFPPTSPEPFERRLALLLIDGILHDPAAAERPAVQKFFQSRMDLILRGLRENPVKEGAMIWKLYNHGFIVRTPTVTIAFDLVRGRSAGVEGFSIANGLVEQIISQCDVLFISHRHGDHGMRESHRLSSTLANRRPIECRRLRLD